MAWFNKDKKPRKPQGETHVQTEGLWVKCDGCKQILWKKDLETNLLCCPKCGYHFKMGARPRLEMFFDDGKFTEHDAALASNDPLKFKDTKSYSERLQKAAKATGFKDALLTGEGRLSGRHAIISAMEFQFIGGSMGAVVGEMITRAIDRALAQRIPLIVVSCSGGARMMEGAISLMQLAKISAGLARLDEVRAPYISILTNPTTGGVTASYAMLGDLNIAEPGALIGFAGPRVIEQTIHKKLPEGFQTSEFLLTHGMLDAIVPRPELKEYVARVLGFLEHEA